MKIVNCLEFQMYSMSISQLFGRSPKISYICGYCRNYQEGRISMKAIEWDSPYIECKNCFTLNKIPISIKENNYE